jgi:two-component system response regulator YesN
MHKVVIADDEQYVRDRMMNHMPWEQLGFEVVQSADCGESAWQAIRDQSPQVVLTDILMPGMSGLDLSLRIMAKYPHTKVVIMSAYDDFKYAQEAIRLGVKGYLLKPVLKDEFMQLFQTISRELEVEEAHPGSRMKVHEVKIWNERNPYIAKAKRYIDEHYEEQIRLEHVAERLHVNANYFSSIFKRETGQSFIDYVNEVRVRRAMELLLKTEEKVSDISLHVGFGNFSYFNKVFKRISGVTPQVYREVTRNVKTAEGDGEDAPSSN